MNNRRRKFIKWIDRKGFRWILATLYSSYAIVRAKKNCSCFFDEVWIHRIGNTYSADSFNFDYYENSYEDWISANENRYKKVNDYWFFQYKPKYGDIIIDVGAGNGSDIPTLSRAVGDTGFILAIEAHPKTFKLLQKTIKWNNLCNVKPIQIAISNCSGTVSIADQKEHVSNYIALNQTHGYTVKAKTLDEVCSEEGIIQIDFLKMNIEGAERIAIQGMGSIINRINHICIACHDFKADIDEDGKDWFKTKKLIRNFLEINNFVISDRDGDPRPYVRDHVHGVYVKS